MHVLYRKYKPYIILTLAGIVSTLLLWLPFILKFDSILGIQTPNISFQTVLSHWDGPLYVIPAKTWYNIKHTILIEAPLGLAPKYFSAHLPLYPLTIALIAPLFGFLKSTIMATLLTSVLLSSGFYYIVSKLKLTKYPLELSLVFLFLTPRFFLIRSIGSPEPLLLVTLLCSMYFFARKNFLAASILGGLALLTKTPGGLLFPAYLAYFAVEYYKSKRFNPQWLWISLIPGAFIGLCFFYGIQLGDPLAYFHSGDNLHLLFPPYQAFNYQARWVGSGWLEDIVFVFLFYAYLLVSQIEFLKNRKTENSTSDTALNFHKTTFYFTLFFFISIISVQHRDISRYSLPLLPLALITFEQFFTSKKFMLALIIIIPAVYLYSWNFMLTNTAPITDWLPFM